jgi:hypothetical protein
MLTMINGSVSLSLRISNACPAWQQSEAERDAEPRLTGISKLQVDAVCLAVVVRRSLPSSGACCCQQERICSPRTHMGNLPSSSSDDDQQLRLMPARALVLLARFH